MHSDEALNRGDHRGIWELMCEEDNPPTGRALELKAEGQIVLSQALCRWGYSRQKEQSQQAKRLENVKKHFPRPLLLTCSFLL